jgi:glycosyltransferase involved in cell wall biosynthesis
MPDTSELDTLGKPFMRILFISPNNLNPDSAAGVHTCEVVRALRGRGHEVTLVARSSEEPGTVFSPVVAWPLVGTFLTEFLHLILLARLLRRTKFDLCYFRFEAHAFLVFLLRRLFNVPLFVEVNGDIREELAIRGAPRRLAWLCRLAEPMIFTAADRILPVTDTLRRLLSDRYPTVAARIQTVPNGVDTEFFRTRRSDETRFVVGYVGSLVEWQSVDLVIRAAGILRNEEIHFEIVGDGPGRAALDALCRREKIEEKVRFRGSIPYRSMPEVISRFSVCVAPKTSLSSGLLPLKFFQYQAMGLPVIVSDVPEMNHLVRDNGTGLVFPVGDAAALAKCVLKLYGDPDLRTRCGAAARQFAEAYSWGKIARMIEREFERYQANSASTTRSDALPSIH